MQKTLAVASVLAFGASLASAGGVDRSGQSASVLFEKGNYAEFSLGYVAPKVSGKAVPLTVPAGLNGAVSGDMSGNYAAVALAYKQQFNERLSGAIIFDRPFGASVDYPLGTNYYAQGSTAKLTTSAITGLVKYTTPSNFSLFGGLRYQTLKADASVPFVGGYKANGPNDSAFGYVIGAAYEKPEIALRVALTYNSRIKHSLTTTETSAAGTLISATSIDTPQSVNLDVQSGIAANTLLFGSIRWVQWTKFNIAPTMYKGLTGGASLVSYDSNTVSYTLGLGRKFSDTWSGAVTVGYEPQVGGFSSNLGPSDGNWSLGLGGTYTKGKVKITGGLRYVGIGDTRVRLGAVAPSANFANNSGLAAGIKVGVTF